MGKDDGRRGGIKWTKEQKEDGMRDESLYFISFYDIFQRTLRANEANPMPIQCHVTFGRSVATRGVRCHASHSQRWNGSCQSCVA